MAGAKSASVNSSKNVAFKHLEVALVLKANKKHFHKNNRTFVFYCTVQDYEGLINDYLSNVCFIFGSAFMALVIYIYISFVHLSLFF